MDELTGEHRLAFLELLSEPNIVLQAEYIFLERVFRHVSSELLRFSETDCELFLASANVESPQKSLMLLFAT